MNESSWFSYNSEEREMTEDKIEWETLMCPDCGLEIKYDVVRHGALIETWVPGACPRCGACLK